jgi:hypothetical protein
MSERANGGLSLVYPAAQHVPRVRAGPLLMHCTAQLYHLGNRLLRRGAATKAKILSGFPAVNLYGVCLVRGTFSEIWPNYVTSCDETGRVECTLVALGTWSSLEWALDTAAPPLNILYYRMV